MAQLALLSPSPQSPLPLGGEGSGANIGLTGARLMGGLRGHYADRMNLNWVMPAEGRT